MTDEERRNLIDQIKEEILLDIPKIVSVAVTTQMSLIKSSKEFYDSHPEFKDHKDIVSTVIELTEGTNPFMDRKKIEEKAVPEIRKKIALLKDLNVNTLPSSKPDLGVL